MKSIPLLLYLVSAGLFGFAGWTVYKMLPLWKDQVRAAATKDGRNDGLGGLALGKGSGGVVPEWSYGGASAAWWPGLKQINLIGKLPPPPPDPTETKPVEAPPPPPVRPLDEFIEIVSIACDNSTQGRGGYSHVIIRYKPEANVQPPEWYVRENTPPTASAAGGPRDTVPAASRVPPRPGVRPPSTPRPATPMPSSTVGQEYLQQLWVDDGGDLRRSAKLWAPFEHIKLVRVADDAQTAFFVRTPPVPKEGEPAIEPKEEELQKSSATLSLDILREMRRLQGREGELPTAAAGPAAAQGTWVDVDETTQINGVRHIGRKDAQRFEADSDRLFEQINVDTYVSKSSSTRGLIVRNVDPKLAQQFGISAGEVLLEINGRAVQTQAQAIQFGKADYKRGVRTFNTKWMANGQIIERVYQAPDK